MYINKNDISALQLAIRELSKDNPIPSDKADAAIHAFLDVLYGRGNWDFEEPQYEDITEELYRGAKTMDFNNLKSIDELMKVAFDPKGDEGLSKGSLSKQQLIDLKQTYTEDAKSTPVGSAQYVEFMNKVKAINEQLSALNRLEEVNDEAYSFKQSATKEAIAPEELSLPMETKEGPRPASHGYGQIQTRLKEKIEEIVSSAEDVNKVRDLAYDAIQLLEALDAQQGATTDETIQNVLK